MLLGFMVHYKWKARLESGYYETKPKQVRRRKIDKDKLRQAIEEKPDMFLHELAQMFDCATQSVHNMLRKLGITRKKNNAHIARRPPSPEPSSTPA